MKKQLIRELKHERAHFNVLAPFIKMDLPLISGLTARVKELMGEETYDYQINGHTHILAISKDSDKDFKFREAIYYGYAKHDLDIQEYTWNYQEIAGGQYSLYIMTVLAFMG